jgi:hypothetical protein
LAGPQVRHLDRLILQAAKETTVRLGQTASGASAVPDAVRLDVALLTRGLEVVRGSHPSAGVGVRAEQAACLGFPPLGALPLMAVYQCLVPYAVEECLPRAGVPARRFETVLGAVWTQKLKPKVALRAREVELDSERAHSPQAHSAQVSAHWELQEWLPQARLPRGPLYWSEEPQPQVPQVQVALARPQAQLVSAQQEPRCWLPVPSREPQASAGQQHPVPVGREPSLQVPQPDACELLWPPHPWRLYPPWPWLLPPLPRPLLPGYAFAPSPRHPREWSLSAFSFL